MTTTELTRYEIDVKDIEYLKHGNKPLLMRVFQPRGKGPFPVIVDLHGGAWCKKDRTSDVATGEALAKAGIAMAALDFRMPPDAGYPASLADTNYAIRWIKSRAAEFGTRPDMVGILGVSSGGHQAMLAAMRPTDKRYAALPLPGNAAFDATVRCVVLCWPVIDPLGRDQSARKIKGSGGMDFLPRPVLGERSGDGRGQPDYGARARRIIPPAARDLPARHGRSRSSAAQPRSLRGGLPQGGRARGPALLRGNEPGVHQRAPDCTGDSRRARQDRRIRPPRDPGEVTK